LKTQNQTKFLNSKILKTQNRASFTKLKTWLPFYIMALPGLAYIFINNYLPMFGLQIAFKQFNYGKGIWGSSWNGLKNFKYLFKTKDAWIITRNTIGYNFLWIIIGTVFGIMVAIFLNEVKSKLSKQIYQTAILLPYLMSTVIVAYLVYAFLSPSNGVINKSLLEPLGIKPIQWYSESKYWPFILTFVNQWKGIGFGAVIYLSAIVGISDEYYEAAQIDGATKWQQIRQITLPLLRPTIITLVILSLGNIFRSDFGLFYQVPMNSGALYNVTSTIDTYVYRGLMQTNDIAMSSAAGFYQSIVGFICVIAVNTIIKKFSREDAIF
jgi:putative aldouronate transport system permease protein